MRIKEYQQGGGLIYTPFIPERQGTPSSRQSSGGEDDPKLDPLDKYMLDLMKDSNLLPSDIRDISTALIGFQRSTQHLSDTAGFGGTGAYRSVQPQMLQIMQMVSTAKFNKDQWDKARGDMMKHDAGAEVAMDSYGRMYVFDDSDKGFKLVTAKEFSENRDSYMPISNSQLLQMRERNNGFQDGMLDSLNDVVGKQDVYKAIDEIIKNYGTSETAKYITKDQAIQNLLIDANSPDGIYKITQKYSKGQLEGAASLLFNQLPTNMQHLLRANAALNGLDPSKGALALVQSIITTNVSDSVKLDYDASASKENGHGGGGGGGSKVSDTYEEHIMNDPLTEITYTKIQPGASSLGLYVFAQDAGPILDKAGKNRFESANLSEVIKNARGIGAIIDPSSITFGDHLVDNTQWSKIVYDNSSNMQRVWMPVKPTADGRMVPDLKAVEELTDINNSIKNKFGDMPNEMAINEWLKGKNINAHYDSNTKMVVFDKSIMKPFLAVKAYANSDVVDRNSPYVWAISNEPNAKAIKTLYNNAARSGYSTSSKDTYDNGTTHSRSNIFSGVLYMPLASSGVATSIFNTERFPVEDYMNIAGKAQEHYREQQMQDSMTLNW